MAKLGVGVVGIGEMGRRHVENLRRFVPNAQLVAVADVNAAHASRVAAEFEIEHSYSSLEAMLERKNIDAVVIATPDKLHAQAIRVAAAAKKEIFCEKPLATSLGDADAAIAAVNQSGVRLQIGFMRRYDPAYSAAMQRIEAGEIGEPVLIKCVGRDKDPPSMAFYEADLNGMLFYNNTIHDFDLARWLMRDEVVEVQACTTVAIRPQVARYGDVVAALVNLKFARGAIGNIESYVQATYGYDVRTEIVGSLGSVFVGTLQQRPIALLNSRGSLQPLADQFLARFADAYLAEVQDFVETMRNDRPPRVTAEDGLRALEIAVAAELSHIDSKPHRVEAYGAAETPGALPAQ
jgi:scyllo-inositol 2-dehydrogenase (NAD+)